MTWSQRASRAASRSRGGRFASRRVTPYITSVDVNRFRNTPQSPCSRFADFKHRSAKCRGVMLPVSEGADFRTCSNVCGAGLDVVIFGGRFS
jgi:hypothetical protein